MVDEFMAVVKVNVLLLLLLFTVVALDVAAETGGTWVFRAVVVMTVSG